MSVNLSSFLSTTYQGSQGVQGLQGLQGLQGVQGLSNQGVQGLQGLQGTQGLLGAQGSTAGTATNLTGGELSNYSENLYAFGNTGATPSFALQNGNFVTATLSANVTSMTFDLTGCPTTTASFGFTLVLTNDATPSRTIAWPASVKWPNATVPTRTTTANKSDVYTFFTYDAGTTWWGNLSLYNFS